MELDNSLPLAQLERKAMHYFNGTWVEEPASRVAALLSMQNSLRLNGKSE